MPSSSALFGSSAGRSQNKNLVEFKAGKMTMKGMMVHPDKRKGLLYVYQSDDSLIHFCWKDRNTGTVEDDLIIFPDDCEFKRVEACKTGRVYVLMFKSSNKKLFFWLQDAKTDKDEENCKKVNEMMNNPPQAFSSRSGGGTPDDLHNLLGSMSQQQLMQLFGSFGSGGSGAGQLPSSLNSLLGTVSSRPSSSSRTSTASAASTTTSTAAETPVRASPTAVVPPAVTSATTTATAGATSTSSSSSSGSSSAPASGGGIQLSDLQRFLSSMGNTTNPPNPAASPSFEVDLSEAMLNSEAIRRVINCEQIVRDLTRHLPEVNEDQPDADRVRDTLQSPQLQQAVRRFGAALSSGQIGPIVQQFDLGEPAVLAALQGNMEEFVKALEGTSVSKDGEEKGESSEAKKEDKGSKDKDDDEKMQEG